jgi:hypothetical protein
MLRKAILLSLPLVILLGTIAVVYVLEEQRTPAYQVVLQQYLARAQSTFGTVRVRDLVEAQHPENFRAGMAEPSISDSNLLTDHLPYPPDQLYCVLIEYTATRSLSQGNRPVGQIVFLAFFDDGLWRQGWMVEEGPKGFVDELIAPKIVQIGCPFKVV